VYIYYYLLFASTEVIENMNTNASGMLQFKLILSGFATTGVSPLNEDVFRDDDFLSSYVSDRPEPTVAQKESSISELYAASQSLFKHICTFIKRKNEATVSPDIIRRFSKAQPQKSASKGRKKGKSRILTDTPNKEEIELIK
jgi:hypothetical protein